MVVETAYPFINVTHLERTVSVLQANGVQRIEVARIANRAFLIRVDASVEEVRSILAGKGICGIASLKDEVPSKFSNVMFKDYEAFLAGLNSPVTQPAS